MPFKPGQSGNPSGRPKATMADGRSLTEVAREFTSKAFETLLKIAESEQSPAAARVSAITVILDRGWGKPKQPVTGGDEDDPPIRAEVDLTGLDDETLRKLAKVCA